MIHSSLNALLLKELVGDPVDLDKGWEFEELKAKAKGGEGQQVIPVEDSWISNIVLEGTEVSDECVRLFPLAVAHPFGCPSVPLDQGI